MKKLFLTVMATIAIAAGANAQLFQEGSKMLHLGIGVGSPYVYSGSDLSIPPIHASFEYGIKEKIGIGGLIGYTASEYNTTFFSSSYSWKFSYLVIGARGAYHFLNNEKMDAYAGLMLAYNSASAKFESSDPDLERLVSEPSVGGVTLGAFLGGRYMFNEKIGAFAELGYNISWLSVGLNVKL